MDWINKQNFKLGSLKRRNEKEIRKRFEKSLKSWNSDKNESVLSKFWIDWIALNQQLWSANYENIHLKQKYTTIKFVFRYFSEALFNLKRVTQKPWLNLFCVKWGGLWASAEILFDEC